MTLVKDKGYDRVKIDYGNASKNLVSNPSEHGAPELPVIQQKFVLPNSADKISVSVVSTTTNSIDGSYLIYPTQPPQVVNEAPQWVEPNEAIYKSDNDYPGKLIEVVSVQSTLGYKIITININPLYYKPLSKKLSLYTQISFNINFISNASNLIVPERISSKRNEEIKKLIKSIVINSGSVSDNSGSVITNNIENGDNYIIPTLPSSLGIIPEEIIITSSEYSSTFETLAIWRTKHGIPTAIVTLNEINTAYSGIDQAERIFRFLKDVYSKYGSTYIILGGDVDIIPARFCFYDGHTEQWRPSDLYYSDIYKASFPNYNWNADGDTQFGDTNDELDLGPDHIVGRMSFNDIQQLDIIINKIISYEGASVNNKTYYNNLLFLSAWDINSKVATIQGYNPNIHTWELYPSGVSGGNEFFNKVNTIANLNTGGAFGTPHHLVYHLDHSSPYNMSTNSHIGESMTGPDLYNLPNSPYYHIFFTNGCSPNAFDFEDAVSEFDPVCPTGGSVGFIGSTATSYSSDVNYYQYFCSGLYVANQTKIGNALYSAMSSSNEFRRRQCLLGDPVMDIWTGTPQNLTVTNSASIYTGQQNLSFTVSGLGLNVTATICIYKVDDVYAIQEITGTGNPIVVSFACKPNSTGTLYANITAHNYIPVQKAITVTNNPGIQLYTSYIHYKDHSSPFWTQKNIPVYSGQTIDIEPTVTNSGLTGATGVVGRVSSISDYVSVSQQYTSYGSVPSLTSKVGSPLMALTIASNTPDHQLVELVFQSGPGNFSYTDRINLEVHAPNIQQTLTTFVTSINNDQIINPSDYVYLTFNFINSGSGLAKGLTGVITSSSPYIQTITSSTQTIGNISAYASGSNASPFIFRVVNNYAQQSIALTLTLTSAYNQQWVFPITLDLPPVITGLNFTSTNNSISPFWTENLTVKGYNLYRSNSISGAFQKINSQTITGFAGYTDADLPEGSIYYYLVRSVSQAGLESANSTVLKAWTTLAYHPNWPQTCNVYNGELRSENSANTADIDGDLKKEIFIGISDLSRTLGTLYGFKENGDEIYYNIGGNPTNINGFYHYSGVGPHCVPAIGDVNNNGVMEVISTTGRTATPVANWVYNHSVLDNNNDLKPDLLWQMPLGGPDAMGPVMSDIDGNNTKEILVKSYWNSPFYVFNSDGTNHSGFPKSPSVNKGGFSMPVACSFNNNSNKQVIYPAQEGIFVFNNNGTPWLAQNPDGMFFNHPGDNMACAPVLADISNTGNSYQMICVSARGDVGRVFILNYTGNTIAGWGYDDHIIQLNDNGSDGWMPSPAVGDIDNDGRLEIIIADAGYIYCWRFSGGNQTGFPLAVPNLRCALESPLIADIDGDGAMDIVVNSNTADGNIYAFHADCSPVVGWPLRIKAFATPVIDDIDNDGMNEIIASEGNVIYVWDTRGLANRVDWGRYRHDSFNSGVFPIGGKKSGETANVVDQTDIQLSVYPNPVSDFLNFAYSLPETVCSVKVRITDVYGKTLDSFTLSDKQGIFKLSTIKYAPGMYMYQVIGYENLSSKFVVTK